MSELLKKAMLLPVPERIRLVEAIWDSIESHSDEIRLTPAQEEELVRRIEYYEKHPDETVSWEELKARTLERLGR